MNRWSLLFFVCFCVEAALVENRDYYNAIKSRYNERISKNPQLSKYKTTIHKHLEKVVGENVHNIVQVGSAFMCVNLKLLSILQRRCIMLCTNEQCLVSVAERERPSVGLEN